MADVDDVGAEGMGRDVWLSLVVIAAHSCGWVGRLGGLGKVLADGLTQSM